MSRYRMDGLSDGFIKGLQIGEAIKTSRVKEQLAGFKAKYAQYADEQQKDIDADDVATRLMEQYDIPSDSAAYHNIYDAARLGKSISSIETMIRNNKASWAAIEAKADTLTSSIDGTTDTPSLDINEQTNAALEEAASEVKDGEPLPTDVNAQTTIQGPRLIQASEGFEGKLIVAESSGDNSKTVTDTKGRVHGGELMFGELRLADYNQATQNNLTVADLKNLNDDQRKALRDWHLKDLTDWANNSGLQEFVGTEINGIKVTSDGILAMAHLGGKTGAENFLRSNGENNPSDEVRNPDGTLVRTYLSDYLKKFGDPQGNIITQTDNALGVETPSEEGNQEQVPPTETGGLISWFKSKHREKITDEILIQTGLTNIDTFNSIMADPTGRGAYTPIRRGGGEPLPLRLVSSDGSTKGNFVENSRLDDETTYTELGGRTLADVFTNETSGRILAQADALIEKLWKEETNIDRTIETADAMLWDTFQRGDEAYSEAFKIASSYNPADATSLDQKYYDALDTMQKRIIFFKSMDDPAKTALAAKTSYMQTIYDAPAWEATEKTISDYKALTSPTVEETAAYNEALATQRELLLSAELVWKETTDASSGGSDTYTQGNYTADKIKQEQILAKTEEERSETEKNWLANFNLTEKAYLAASDATTTAADPDEIVVTYVDSNGVTKSKNVYVNPEGGYIDPATGLPWNAQTTSEDGQKTPAPFTITRTQTLAEADDSQQAVSQASSVISPINEKWITVSQLSTNARNLSDKVAEYEFILSSAGALNSFWKSFNTEIQGFMSWMETNGSGYDSSNIMAAVDDYNEGAKSLQSFKNEVAADVYKQFQADMVRFIFSVGRAEGQAGNGFSNQDYRVLSKSVNAGNNFAVFTKTLKDYVKGQWQVYDNMVRTGANTPVVMNARRTTDVFDILLQNNQSRFTKEKVDEGILSLASFRNYEWSQSPSGQIVGVLNDTQDEITSKLGKDIFPEELETDINTAITNGEKFYILLLPNGNYYLQEFAR